MQSLNSKGQLRIFTGNCSDISLAWTNAKITPQTPIEHNTSVNISCDRKYINLGTGSARCYDGNLMEMVSNSSAQPNCVKSSNVKSLTNYIRPWKIERKWNMSWEHMFYYIFRLFITITITTATISKVWHRELRNKLIDKWEIKMVRN